VVCRKESADALQTQRPDVKQEIAMFQNTFAQAEAVIVHDAAIAAAIDAAMLRRRDEYAGQPMAWKVFCEASHVATLRAASHGVYQPRGQRARRRHRPAPEDQGRGDPRGGNCELV
jgi:hypothetical protein